MDPRVWDAEADVKVNPIGRTDDATKMQALGAIAQKQEQIIMALGPDNPVCGLQELRNTYADFTKLSGFKDAGRYFKDPSLAPPAQAQQGQKGDPTDKLVQVELQKAADTKEVAMARLAEERRKNDLQDDRERDRAETDAILKAQELLGKYGIQVNQQQIDYATQRDRNAVQERVGLHRNEIQGQVAQQRLAAPPGGPNGTA
jgi:predicted NodU family carbamoyl transferase